MNSPHSYFYIRLLLLPSCLNTFVTSSYGYPVLVALLIPFGLQYPVWGYQTAIFLYGHPFFLTVMNNAAMNMSLQISLQDLESIIQIFFSSGINVCFWYEMDNRIVFFPPLISSWSCTIYWKDCSVLHCIVTFVRPTPVCIYV